MNVSLIVRRILKWTIAVVATLIIVVVGLAALLEAGYGRGLLVHYFALRFGRPVQVNGALTAHLFSLSPQVMAERVTIGNPSWTPPGTVLEADRLALALKLPRLWHRGGITAIDVQGATLHLIRDASGRANWQLRDPAKKRLDRNSSIVRSVSMPNARVTLDDARRHLQFVGTVSLLDSGGAVAAQPLRIDGAGQLNGHAMTFAVTADPLATASHKMPYHFTFTERSGGSHLEGKGVLPQPFLVQFVDATFVAAGPDLKDLYFLTGVHLIDTGEYHLSGNFARRDTRTTFSELSIASGSSDVHGSVSTDSASGRPRFTVNLRSTVLKMSDLGIRAAGRTTEPKPPLLLSDAMISPNVLHAAGATATYHADRVEIGRVTIEQVSLQATLGKDVLTVAPFVATLSGGRVDGHLTLDGSKKIPTASVDLGVADVQLGRLVHSDTTPPPLEGTLQARVRITGSGRSVHQVAASANGTVTMQMPLGAVRESFAELTDVDLRGLGLLLVKNKREVPVRCAIAKFKAQNGTLTAEDLLVDTDPVLITGEGQIHLDSEALDLTIRGNPKSLRLFRFRAPVLVQGTLARPAFHVQVKHSHFMLADRGQAGDVDCTALLAGRPASQITSQPATSRRP